MKENKKQVCIDLCRTLQGLNEFRELVSLEYRDVRNLNGTLVDEYVGVALGEDFFVVNVRDCTGFAMCEEVTKALRRRVR